MLTIEKQLEVTVSIRNNLLKKRRVDAALTQKQLGMLCDVRQTTISAAECFRHISRKSKIRIADYFDCSVEQIFPQELDAIKKNKAVRYADTYEVQQLMANAQRNLLSFDEDVERRIELADLEKETKAALLTLSARAAQIIRLRFGLNGVGEHTRSQVAAMYRVSAERIGQIEIKALRRLRHPSRSMRLLATVSITSADALLKKLDSSPDSDLKAAL